MVSRARSEKIEVVFQPYDKRGRFPSNVTILKAARSLGVQISSLCNGKGSCGKCKVRVQQKQPRRVITGKELKYLSEDELNTNFRLACQARLTSSSTIFVPFRSQVRAQRLQIKAFNVPVNSNPLVRKYFIRMTKPTLKDPRSDEDRLLDALNEQHGISNIKIIFEVSKNLSIILRDANWNVTAVIWKDEIRALEPGDTSGRCFGFAADVGSTKLAGFLMDLNKGEVVAVGARMNPQISFGEDIISRMTHAIKREWKGVHELQKAVISGINEIIDECCRKAHVKTGEIYELNFVGNTAMQLFFLGIWPRYLTLSPYPPVLRRGVDVDAAKLDLKSHRNANAHYVPVIGGYVGADNVAVVLATKMFESKDIMMAIDIGTNTEIDIGNKDLIMANSCASGPAFEGMEIRFGMRATTGAIERISINPETLKVHYQTIDNTHPVGLCGSALVDAPAELLKSGLIGQDGNFVPEKSEKTNRLRKGSEGWEFVVAWRDETSIETDIMITQGDIRELQKAKAAIHTGAEILMRRMDVNEKEISKLVIAGAFGNRIDPVSARTIGMYPEIPLDRIQFAGNVAGIGATLSLISREMRDYTERISKAVRYHELAADRDFQDEYVKSLYFPHVDLKKYPRTMELLQKLQIS